MKRFQNQVYVRVPEGLFVYDSGWESFRPTSGIVWNPTARYAEPWYGSLVSDPLDPNYGFGSSSMKVFCSDLTDKYIDQLESAEDVSLETFWQWSKAPVVWAFDRPMVFPPCVSPSWDAWKSYIGKRHRTLRRAPRTFDFRATKRRIR